MKEKDKKYIVKLFDGFDFKWIDVSKPVSKEKAREIWNEKTKKGTEKTCFDDIDYYAIFPADIIMKYSNEGEFNKFHELEKDF